MTSLPVVDGVSWNGVAGRVSGVWGEPEEDAFWRYKEGLEGGDSSSVDAVLLLLVLHQDLPGGIGVDFIGGGGGEGVATEVHVGRADDAARIFSISITTVAVFRIWITDHGEGRGKGRGK